MNLIGLDFETYWADDYTLSKMTTEEYVRDPRFRAHMLGYAVVNEQRQVLEKGVVHYNDIGPALARLDLENNAVLCHHSQFDGLILSHHYGHEPKMWFDTMSMSRPVVGAMVGASLAKLATHFECGVKGEEVLLTKNMRTLSGELQRKVGAYCLNDVRMMLGVFYRLLPAFSKDELELIDITIRMFTEPRAVLDTVVLDDYIQSIVVNRSELILQTGLTEHSLRSSTVFSEQLKRLGVVPPTKISKTTNQPTFAFAKNDEAMVNLMENGSDAVQALLAARFGVMSTGGMARANRLKSMATRGPACAYFKYYGAETTGRHAGADKMNWQNLNRPEYDERGVMDPTTGLLRKAVTAPEGHVIVVCDSSNIENRALVALAGQADAVERFKQKVDPYCFLASRIFGREVTKADKVERFIGKVATLGLGYQMGDTKFFTILQVTKGPDGNRINLPLITVSAIVQTFRQTYGRVAALWGAGKDALQAMFHGRVTGLGVGDIVRVTPSGITLPSGFLIKYHKLRVKPIDPTGATAESWRAGNLEYFDYRSKKWVHIYGGKVVENVVQALARIVVYQQAVRIGRRLRKEFPGAQIIMLVHDEVVVICRTEDGPAVKAMMLEEMSKSPEWWPWLPVAAEAGIGTNYRDAK